MATENNSNYRYPGTKPFEAADYELFKGREDDILKLFDLVFVQNPVVLFSRSGLGKSSLLNAGLYNKIINENKATPLFVRLGAYKKDSTVLPLDKLYEIINNEIKREQNPLSEILSIQAEDRENSLWYKFKNIQINDPAKKCFVLIFDQFEELFTYSKTAIDLFKKELSELIYINIPQKLRDFINVKLEGDINYFSEKEADLLFTKIDIRLLFAIRSDKLSLLNSFADFFPTILKNCYELKPLNFYQAKQAIIYPAQLTSKKFQSQPFTYNEDVLKYILDSLTETHIHEMAGGILENPEIETFQLQIVCKYAEDKVIEKGLTEITRNDLGEIKKIFETQYRNIITKLPKAQQLTARKVIEEKLIVGETRVSMPIISLLNDYKSAGITAQLIDDLINSHLIRRDQAGSVEISHDTLVAPILKAKKERDDKDERDRQQLERQEEIKKQKAEQEIKEKELAKTRTRLRVYGILLVIAFFGLIAAYIYSDIADRAVISAKKNEAQAKENLQKFQKTEFEKVSKEVDDILSRARVLEEGNYNAISEKMIKDAEVELSKYPDNNELQKKLQQIKIKNKY